MKFNQRYQLIPRIFINWLVIGLSVNHAAYASLSVAEEVNQSIQYSIGQQRQFFSFESQNLHTEVLAQNLQYQYSLADKLFGISLSHSSAAESKSSDTAYQLELAGQSVLIFTEFKIENFWLGMAASQGNDDSQYQFYYNNVQADVSDSMDFRNLTIDMDYGRFLSSSYGSVGAGLTHQWLVTKRQLMVVRTLTPIASQNSNSSEQALFGSVNANYTHYFNIGEQTELILSGAVNYQLTLSGDGRIQLNQQRRRSTGVQKSQLSKKLEKPNSEATSLSARLTLLHDAYAVSAEIYQLSDQSAADAYYGFGLGVDF